MGPPRKSFSPNWFVAIPVAAGDWFDQAVSQPPQGVRRFHPEDLHMTVAFLGGITEQEARAGWEALVWPTGSVSATLGAVIPMGNPRRYSALSIELVDGREPIEQAISACRDAICDAAGARRENRPAKAHITVARPLRRASDTDREAGLRWAKRLDFVKQRIELTSVALYTWADDRRERQFKIVEKVLMGDGAAGSP